MQLTYKQLEATLVAHFRIHPEKTGTFRSRIKQLQRLGFPPGTNVGRGAKMEYSAAHLFQFATAFELIGAGLPADRATKIVTSHWTAFQGGYGIAVEQLRKVSFDRNLFAWVLSRSFGDLQVDLYPGGPFPMSSSDAVRVVVGDCEGVSDHLLGVNPDRRAHCYTLLPISDLAVRLLKSAENFGGFVAARVDPEFREWLPNKKDTREWLFAGWKPVCEKEFGIHDALSTEEVITNKRVAEQVQRRHNRVRLMKAEAAADEVLKVAAKALVPALPAALRFRLTNDPKGDSWFRDMSNDHRDLLVSLSLLSAGPRVTWTLLGRALLRVMSEAQPEDVNGDDQKA